MSRFINGIQSLRTQPWVNRKRKPLETGTKPSETAKCCHSTRKLSPPVLRLRKIGSQPCCKWPGCIGKKTPSKQPARINRSHELQAWQVPETFLHAENELSFKNEKVSMRIVAKYVQSALTKNAQNRRTEDNLIKQTEDKNTSKFIDYA